MGMPTTTAGAMAAMDMASVQLMLRLPLTMAGEAMAAMDMARGLLMPMPTTAGEDMVATDMARDPLMLMPTTAGEDMEAMDTESKCLSKNSIAISNCLDLILLEI